MAGKQAKAPSARRPKAFTTGARSAVKTQTKKGNTAS